MNALQWGNLATVAYLLFAPHNRQLGAMVYALADGPLAAALIAWQSAWVFGSTEHSIRCCCALQLAQHLCKETGEGNILSFWRCLPRSVLIHLLPGLALFAHRHCRAPEPVVQVWQYLWGPPPADVAADAPVSFFWISGAPLLFYAAWQLMYFIIVQVGFWGCWLAAFGNFNGDLSPQYTIMCNS